MPQPFLPALRPFLLTLLVLILRMHAVACAALPDAAAPLVEPVEVVVGEAGQRSRAATKPLPPGLLEQAPT